MSSPKKLLVISPTSLDTLIEYKVDRLLLEADEEGYFEKVFRCHPLTPYRRRVAYSPNLDILEFTVPKIVRPGVTSLLRRVGLLYHFVRLGVVMAHLARREGVTIIRAMDPYLCGIVGLIAARLSRLPLCVSIHSDYDLCYETAGAQGAPVMIGSRGVAKRIERFILSRADLVLPIREHLVPKVIANGAPKERVRVIPHGIDIAPFLSPADPTIRPRLGVQNDLKILSFVGRLSKENLVDDLMEMLKTLVRQRDDFVLVMAGNGSKLEEFRRMLEDAPFPRRHLVLTGPLSIADVAALRKASTVSLCLMGGFSLIEACAAGSAVVAYDIDWHSELVHDGKTGFLCPKGNIEILTKRVCSLLDSPNLSEQMGKNAHALAFSRHSLAKSSQRRILAYEELVEPSKSGQ